MSKKKKNNTSPSKKGTTKKKTAIKKTKSSVTASTKLKTRQESAKKTEIDAEIIEEKKQTTPVPNTPENTELLNKIVNAGISEDEKEKTSENTSSTTQSETKPRRKRRKKGERTWEEKAKKLPTFEVSNFPKLPVKSILITQAKPSDLQNPYQLLIDKYKVQLTFRPFIKVEGLTAQEFRNQRVDVLEYNAIIFTSRLAIDHFFRIMNEMRISIPDSVKFICMNEQIAYYMQKYMELRKRRILWGLGTIDDLGNVLKKNIDRKFLLPASDTIKEKVISVLNELKAKYTPVDLYKTIPENISDLRPEKYDMIVFFTPIAVEALHKNFPKFKQNKTRFAAYSILTANKIKELGYRVDIFAPTLEFPSMVNAIAHYLLHIDEK
ncbi:MAG: uroporphyrinogen-III synthase [Bacteroidetes bacterium]|nr:MAG: uroporphyrinogen-III synthase [Bacteroidota bacterium]